MKNDVILWDFFVKNARMILLDEYIPRVESVIETCKKEGKYLFIVPIDGIKVNYSRSLSIILSDF